MARSTLEALDAAARRQALRRASLVVASIAAVDLAIAGGAAFRAAVWGGWLVLFLGASVVVVRGPRWVTPLVGLVTSAGVLLALFLLAAASGGSHSLYFLVATMVPILSVLLAPDDTVDAALQGAVVLAAGVVLQAQERIRETVASLRAISVPEPAPGPTDPAAPSQPTDAPARAVPPP